MTTNGVDGFFEYVNGWLRAFSNMTIETRSTVVDERHAAGEFLGGGSHDGPLHTPGGEVPATGCEFKERFVWFAELADAKITSLRDYYNAMAVMVQLGMLPAPAA